MRITLRRSPGSLYASVVASPASAGMPDSPAGAPPLAPSPPETARAGDVAAATDTNAVETRGDRLRRGAHQGRLHGYAMAIVALIVVLIALAATNTAHVRVNWLVGSSRVSLVWLVLAAAIIGWILGVLASVRFQWLTRAPRAGR